MNARIKELLREADERGKRCRNLCRKRYSKKHRELQRKISQIIEDRSLMKSFNERNNQMEAYLSASRGGNVFLEVAAC